ncbi:MAG TPA: ATP-binding protein [Planctomicrobium sp.]|nr:ATP-binding protein [Planctomicrobium sp.]
MDTLGTIVPKITGFTETAPRIEAFERLRYLGQNRGTGVLFGEAGTGKSFLLERLAQQLRRDGISVAQINLSGLGGPEIAHQVAIRLGLGVSFHAPEFEIWARIQEYSESGRLTGVRLAFLLDHFDRTRESALMPLARLMDLFVDQAAWVISSRPVGDRWKTFLDERHWLQVELKELQPRESAQMLTRHIHESLPNVHFTPDGLAEAHELSGGEIRCLKQLAELAALTAEVDGFAEIDAETLRSLVSELALSHH